MSEKLKLQLKTLHVRATALEGQRLLALRLLKGVAKMQMDGMVELVKVLRTLHGEAQSESGIALVTLGTELQAQSSLLLRSISDSIAFQESSEDQHAAFYNEIFCGNDEIDDGGDDVA